MTLRGMFRLTVRETRLYVIFAGTFVLLALGPAAAARLNDRELPGNALVLGFYLAGAAWIFYAVWHRSAPSRRRASAVAREAEALGLHYPRRFRMPESMLALPTLNRVFDGEVTFSNAFAGRIDGRSAIVFDRTVQIDGYTPARTITCAAAELNVDAHGCSSSRGPRDSTSPQMGSKRRGSNRRRSIGDITSAPTIGGSRVRSSIKG